MYENARKYNLTGTDAMVFEALCHLCRKTGDWKGSFATLARFSCCGNHDTARRCFERLISLGLIAQNAQGYAQIAQSSAQNAQNPKEKGTEKENINKEKSGVVIDHTTHTTFLDFFNIFSPNGEYKTYEKSCQKIWQKMPEDWRKQAVDMANFKAQSKYKTFFGYLFHLEWEAYEG